MKGWMGQSGWGKQGVEFWMALSRTAAQQGLAALMNILLQKFVRWMRSENLCKLHIFFFYSISLGFWIVDCGFWFLVFQVAWPRRTWPNLRYYYAKWPAEATPELSYPLPLWSGLHLWDFKSSWECDSTPSAGAEAEVSGGCLRPVCTRDTAVTQSPAARIFAQLNRDQSAL